MYPRENICDSLAGPIGRVWRERYTLGKRCYCYMELLMKGGKEYCVRLFSVTYCLESLVILVPGTTVKSGSSSLCHIDM